MTLRFFGATPAARVELLADGLRALAECALPCTARMQSVEYWPPRAPRVVVAVFDAPSPLQELAAAIERLAQQLGYPPEPRAFRAHVTLARNAATRLPDYTAPLPPIELAVTTVSLMQSHLTPGGAQYTALHRYGVGATKR